MPDAIIVIISAVLSAVVTGGLLIYSNYLQAKRADLRLDTQLEQERKRLDAQFTHNQEMLKTQLAHEDYRRQQDAVRATRLGQLDNVIHLVNIATPVLSYRSKPSSPEVREYLRSLSAQIVLAVDRATISVSALGLQAENLITLGEQLTIAIAQIAEGGTLDEDQFGSLLNLLGRIENQYLNLKAGL